MSEFIIRNATINDIPLLVDTIIEAEKSGTDVLSYSSIFGLSEEEVRKYLNDILYEEIDGCELSVSSFIVAECNGKTAGAVSAWIEGAEGIPSAVIKGNLLNYSLPKRCIENAVRVNEIIRDLDIEYFPNTIQLGAGYVVSEFRGKGLLGLLESEIIARLAQTNPNVKQVWAQIFYCNIPSIRTFEKANFELVLTKESSNEEILKYLPSNKKVLMKKELVVK